jgi:MoaA/NifB/PqqE/SkfB family radical SAM enzyme
MAPRVRTGVACSSRCRFCDQADLRPVEPEVTAPEVEAALEAAARGGARAVVLVGGEVTLRPELPEWIRRATALGIARTVIQTNGRALASPRYLAELLEAGSVGFAVALHGHLAALHDWLTRVPGSFDETLRGLQNLRAAGAPLLLNTVITRPNFRHLPEIVALGARHGARQCRFHWLRPEGDAARFGASLTPQPALVRPHLERAAQVARALGTRLAIDWGGLTRDATAQSPP